MRIDVFFGKELVQRAIKFQCGRQVVAEGLFDDHARIIRATGFRQSFGDCSEQAGRHRQVVQRRFGIRPIACEVR